MRIKGPYLTIGLRGEPVNRPQLRFLLNLIDAGFSRATFVLRIAGFVDEKRVWRVSYGGPEVL